MRIIYVIYTQKTKQSTCVYFFLAISTQIFLIPKIFERTVCNQHKIITVSPRNDALGLYDFLSFHEGGELPKGEGKRRA